MTDRNKLYAALHASAAKAGLDEEARRDLMELHCDSVEVDV